MSDSIEDPLSPAALFDLDGAVVLLTGASSGMGERFARVLDAAGANVVLAARRRERLETIAADLTHADVLPFDLSDPARAHELVETVVERHGRLDVLVNNAGITNVTPALHERLEDVRRVLDVNLVVPYVLAQAAARAMRSTGGGSIVNVASISATTTMPSIPEASYVASKGGLVSLTRELGVQWARYGVRVNGLAPGMFWTEMTAGLNEHPDHLAAFEAGIPLKRVGEVTELDAALLFLTSPANTYMTGQVVVVDGGTSAV